MYYECSAKNQPIFLTYTILSATRQIFNISVKKEHLLTCFCIPTFKMYISAFRYKHPIFVCMHIFTYLRWI